MLSKAQAMHIRYTGSFRPFALSSSAEKELGMRNRAAFLQWVGRMSPPNLPFFIVHLECGDLVIIVISEEEFHDGVIVDCGGTPGERGRRCPCSRWWGCGGSDSEALQLLGCDILDDSDRFKLLAFFLLSALCQDVAEKHLCAYHSWFFGTAAT